MSDQLSSSHDQFWTLLITRTEIKKSVTYAGTRYTFVEYKGQNHARIELNDASGKSCRI